MKKELMEKLKEAIKILESENVLSKRERFENGDTFIDKVERLFKYHKHTQKVYGIDEKGNIISSFCKVISIGDESFEGELEFFGTLKRFDFYFNNITFID